jgi:hypothetical protein
MSTIETHDVLRDERNIALVEKYKNISILLPIYKVMDTKCVSAFYVFISQLYKYGFQPKMLILDQTLIVAARNELASWCVELNESGNQERKSNTVMWIDSDHVFTINDFFNLLYHYDRYHKDGVVENGRVVPKIDILSGRYVTRDVVTPKVCGFLNKGESDGTPLWYPVKFDTTGIVEVDAVGFGYILMDYDVLKTLVAEHGKHLFELKMVGDKTKGGVIGEDMVFCQKAQKAGYKIYLDNDVEVGHMGGIIDTTYILAKRYIDNAKAVRSK